MFSRSVWIVPRALCGFCLFLSLCLLAPPPAYPQTTLTGAMWFASTPTGATSVEQGYADGVNNTLGGDQWWDLWFALKPDGSSPVNGPADSQASISIPLQTGQSYKYYIFGAGTCCTLPFSGLNLFFDGNGSTPGISVFGPVNGFSFVPNASSTLTLEGNPGPASGTGFYNSAGAVVVLTGYNWNDSASLDVCQPFAFSPGNEPSAFGSFTLRVWPAATLSLSQTGGPPGTEVTTNGSGYAPAEIIAIYANHIGGPALITTKTDANGAFTIGVHEPQAPYGPVDLYAVGLTSGKLGAASFFISAAMPVTPAAGVPGDTTTAHALGFGAGETVDVYWGEPRQLLGTTIADGKGTGTLTITIPANAPRGPNEVLGVGQTTQATGFGEIVVK
jgi:hypothetical protein